MYNAYKKHHFRRLLQYPTLGILGSLSLKMAEIFPFVLCSKYKNGLIKLLPVHFPFFPGKFHHQHSLQVSVYCSYARNLCLGKL